MVLIDGIKLTAESTEELHKFAHKITLSRSWFHPGNPAHYDMICPHVIQRALNCGARYKKVKKNLVKS